MNKTAVDEEEKEENEEEEEEEEEEEKGSVTRARGIIAQLETRCR